MEWLLDFLAVSIIVLRVADKIDSSRPSISPTEEQKLRAEVRRINATFGVFDGQVYIEVEKNLSKGPTHHTTWVCSKSDYGAASLEVKVRDGNYFLVTFDHLDGSSEWWSMAYHEGKMLTPITSPQYQHAQDMLKALYCQGTDTTLFTAYYNVHLSAHEKLELRLSLPREFWPQNWLDKEGFSGGI